MDPYDLHIIETEGGCQINLFPTPIFKFNLKNKINLKNIIEFVETYNKDYKHDWEKYSNHDIITTPDILNEDQRFFELIDCFDFYINQVIKKLNIKNNGYYLMGLWANIHRKCASHHSHQHPNSFLSGVFYLNIPKNSGNLYFEDPRESKTVINYDFDNHDPSMYQYRSWEIKPKEGDLIIFPSWLRHGTQPSNLETTEHRISMSFNVYPRYESNRNTMRIKL